MNVIPAFRELDEYSFSDVWDAIVRLQGCVFVTCRGMEFVYEVRGGELFVDRKSKSITKSTVRMAYEKARALEVVAGPKKLGTFGASYLYPIFVTLGVCRVS